MVRAKFLCTAKGEAGNCPNSIVSNIILTPVTNGSEENKKFYKYTPSGKIELSVINPVAADQFEVGKEYYIDFIPVSNEVKK